ncbi:12309_t:CDS:2 [Funneliformis mosseae]|uniref:12309_t:CDS:1 n=1 Tax=Funneliformis mosseae TaxID=27381 RepID=A0A9N9BG04_FUNMO|nr:12309_t:CDS:2 [Funneliformis mosseae]
MSEHEFESKNRQIISNEENDDEDDDNGLCYDFVVKKAKSKRKISKILLDSELIINSQK